MDFFFLLKIWEKILIKIELKISVVNIARNFFIMLNNLQQMDGKLLQKQ